MMRAIVGAGLVVFTSWGVFGQPPAFEVASVKVSEIGRAGGEGSRRENVQTSPGTLMMRNVSLRSCVQWAYNVKDFQVSGPGWLESERYDIAAKAPGPTPEGQLRLMLQTLLADRFKVTLHREEKVLPVYALVVGKNGPKLHESVGEGESSWKPGRMNVVAQRIPMSQLADLLSGPLRSPVLDMTGLKGRYDFTLDLAAYLAGDSQPGELRKEVGALADSATFISMALQELLGLRLEARKMGVAVLVVDHAEKIPTEN